MTTTDFSSQFSQLELFLYNFAMRLTRHPDRAKDLIQDTGLRAFKYRKNFKPGTNFKGWVATIMRNTFVTNFRKEQRKRSVNEPVENFAFALESKSVVSNKGEMNLRLSEIKQHFEKIGDLYAVPFMLHHQGFGYKEISERLGTPIGTIKSRIFMARKKMKNLIKDRKSIS